VPLERLQKLIARAGVCSRRDAEVMIRERRVTVNGEVAHLGSQADLEKDSVKVDGKRLAAPEKLRTFLFYKPPKVMTTTDDPEGRPTVLEYFRRINERIFPVGRLDFHSEGLVLLTNDGELALRVAHPRYGVLREYVAKVKGVPEARDVERLQRGTLLEGQRVVPKEVVHIRTTPSGMNSFWRVVVGEGKTHEVREMFHRIGHPVQRLVRVAIGPLSDPKLRPGTWRELSEEEVELLRHGGGRGRREGHARAEGSGVHAQGGHLRAGQAGGRGGAGAGRDGDRQAGVQRKPARVVAQGPGRRREGPPEPEPLSGRGRVRAAPRPRRAPRG